jgi:hypothetical protein
MPLRTTFLWTMIGAFAIAAALGVIAVLVDGLGRTGERVLVTSLLVGGFSLACLVCAFVLDRRKVRGVMWLGIATSLAGLLLWLVLVWFERWRWVDAGEVLLIKSAGTMTIVSLWSVHLGLIVLPVMHRRSWRIVRIVTLATAAILSVMLLFVMWTESFNDVTEKFSAVLAILGSCGTVVTPVLALIERLQHRGRTGALAGRVSMRIVCPRCGTAQSLAVGKRRCTECGLQVTIDVEEPRCTCGYLLYQLEGERCPECGREIPESDRWAASADSS